MNTANVIGSDNFFITPIGLDIISEDATYDEWLAFGKELSRRYSAIQWAIGDWINFGERKFGEMYAQALDDTHFAYGTLRNYASICARIPAENRSPKLTFHQTKHVARLEPHEQRAIIDAAVKHEMTGDDIQEAVQRVQGKQPQTRESIEGWVLHNYDVMGDEYIVKIRVDKAGLDYLQEVYTVTIKAKP